MNKSGLLLGECWVGHAEVLSEGWVVGGYMGLIKLCKSLSYVGVSLDHFDSI